MTIVPIAESRLRPSALRLELLEARDVPAVLYVDPSLAVTADTGDSGLSAGDTVTFNAGRPGEVVNLVVGQTAFTDLASALDAAAANDTLRLASGTFTISAGQTVTRSVSVEGIDLASTQLVPAGDTAVQGAGRALLTVGAGVNFNLSRLTIDGLAGTRSVAEFIRFDGGNGTIRGVTFRDIAPAEASSADDGFAVTARGGEVFVRDSRFSGVGRTGVLATGTGTRLAYAGNVATGGGGAAGTQRGVELSDSAAGFVTGSHFSRFQGPDSAAVLVDGTDAAATTATLVGNSFESNLYALRVGLNASDASRVAARFNNFVGNTFGVASSALSVDAANNYWGNSTGPRTALNPGGGGDTADARTNFAPFNTQRLQRATAFTLDGYLDATRSSVAASVGTGGPPAVAVFDADGRPTRILFAYDPAYLGGVNVALGDVTGDGVADVVTGAATGAPHVKVFDGATGAELASFFAFDPASGVGVTVAVGDTDGDGNPDIILGAGRGGLPLVRVLQGGTNLFSRAFLAFDEAFRGGVDVAAADLANAGYAQILASPLASGLGAVRQFDLRVGAELLRERFVFDASYVGGLAIAAGDLDGDGVPDLIASTSSPGVSQVRAVSGRDGTTLRDVAAGEARSRSGARATVQRLGVTAAGVLAYAAPERGGTRLLIQRLDGTGFLRTLTPFGSLAGPIDLA